MMPPLSLLAVALAVALGADERIEKLPQHYRAWLEEEVVYVISDVEKEAFLRLASDEEREAFIDVFWRKRDLNPATPENEYRDEHYRRLDYANEFLGRDTFRPGWRTDRGRFYILLGEPRSRQNFEAKDQIYPAELWFYNNPELKSFGLPPFFSLLFFRRHGTGEFQLYDPIGDGPQALLTRVDSHGMDFRQDIERAYNALMWIDPELAKVSLSFMPDEGDLAQFQASPFGTVELLDNIVRSPFHGLDTSYAERLDFERGAVESDYLFRYVPSAGMMTVLPGPEDTLYLHWVIEIAPENMAFVEDRDSGGFASRFVASVEIETRQEPKALVVQERKESFVALKHSEKAALHAPFSYSGMVPMVPGDYTVRVILRNRACPGRDERDCLKSYTLLDGEVRVPEWPRSPALSDLVLAHGSALRGGEPAYRSFRFGSREVFPNPSGVFALGERIAAAVEPLNAPEGSSIRFQMVSEDVAGQVAVDQTVPLPEEGLLVQELVPDTAVGSRYQLSAALLDPSGQELDRRSVPLTVSPRSSIPRPSMRSSMLQIRPELPGSVQMTLAEQYLALQRKDEARALLEQALAANAKLGPARERLAQMELEGGNHARVIELLEPLYREVKDRFEVLAPLGEAYFREQRFEEAAEVLERVVALRRPDPSVLNMLANAVYRLGNRERAQELLEKSLELDPNQKGVEEILGKIKAERSGR
jgi:GWxTD domain-containing protein